MTRLTNLQVRYQTVDKLSIEKMGNCFSVIVQAKDLSNLRVLERKLFTNLNEINVRYDNSDLDKVKNIIING